MIINAGAMCHNKSRFNLDSKNELERRNKTGIQPMLEEKGKVDMEMRNCLYGRTYSELKRVFLYKVVERDADTETFIIRFAIRF